MPNIVISDRDIILDSNNNLLDDNRFQELKSLYKDAVYFEEKNFSLKVLALAPSQELSSHLKKILLREYYYTHSTEENFSAFRAKALYEWRNECVYCCKCGTKLTEHLTLTARECPSCKKIIFPRINPCIIVVVEKEGKILLAKHTYRNQDIYACIAGFMEAGESAEEAVEREVFEETGLKIKNITYRGSQSWPFPDQLMLGFTADWESGEIKLQESEIADAQWFDRDNCPASPKPGSIAYQLIHKLYK